MDNATLLYQLITVSVLLIPIASLIWKAAKQSAMLEEHERRINKLERIDDIIDQINLSIVELRKDIQFIKEQLKKND